MIAWILVALGAAGGVLGAVLWVGGWNNSEPLAALGLVFAVLVWVWSLVPAVLGVVALLTRRQRARVAGVLVWIGCGWHACWVVLAALVLMPGLMST